MPDNAPELDISTRRGLAALDQLTQEWWSDCGMDEPVAGIAALVPGPFKERMFDTLARFIKQAHTEGLYQGFLAGRDFPKAKRRRRNVTPAGRQKIVPLTASS